MGEDTENTESYESVDEVNADSVKEERKSLTKGPVASVLLLLLGLAGLIGIGGFWAYPQYKEYRETNFELENLDEAIAENKKELRRIEKENEERPPSKKEIEYQKIIPITFDTPQSIRDMLNLAALDPTNPDDDLLLSSFTFSSPIEQSGYATIDTALIFSGSSKSLSELFKRINQPGEYNIRLATPVSLALKYETFDKGLEGSPAEQRLNYLMRQKKYHLISKSEERELITAKAVRVADYQDALLDRDKAVASLRLIESQKGEGADLLRNTEELIRARAEVKSLNDKIKRLESAAESSLSEIDVSMNLELYVESDPNAKADAATTASDSPVKKKKK